VSCEQVRHVRVVVPGRSVAAMATGRP
jgi:hypothetical protein